MTSTLRILVEGDTEERFANRALVPHLAQHGVWASASKVVTSGRRGGTVAGKGGGRSYLHWRRDLLRWIQQEGSRPEVYFTTMLDVYGLARLHDFPGYPAAQTLATPRAKVEALEQAWAKDIGFCRFIHYLQLHEFEALVLVDVRTLEGIFPDCKLAVGNLAKAVTAAARGPEEINDGEETAPSKRIIQHLPQYGAMKPVAGPQVAVAVGLPRLRAACPHFGQWLTQLEALGQGG